MSAKPCSDQKSLMGKTKWATKTNHCTESNMIMSFDCPILKRHFLDKEKGGDAVL